MVNGISPEKKKDGVQSPDGPWMFSQCCRRGGEVSV